MRIRANQNNLFRESIFPDGSPIRYFWRKSPTTLGKLTYVLNSNSKLAIGTILTVVGGITGPKYLSSAPPAAAPAASPAPAQSSEPELDVEKAIK
ncbi:hypothetical protein OGAPHI_005934 [Ogataea philodendri]|uniref:Uncharacterized protein n=1 Tax=Ogataea philodendri TaxID=1378263 RepID=A0A9P8T0R8_9ASCO|nr:uncharacterized protein OGAPHI_005934 [Ogataea philodendri]KAH3661756.1 hypothetical protein OGAPHI_005934 [Ogataea philodendri]